MSAKAHRDRFIALVMSAFRELLKSGAFRDRERTFLGLLVDGVPVVIGRKFNDIDEF
jgi:hypothetical protein